MYCENCGNKIDKNDKFCDSCGYKVGNIAHSFLSKKNSSDELEKKAWYRAVKVIYIGLLALVIFIILFVSFETMPERKIDGDKSTISCYNGKSYSAERNSIYLYGNISELSYSDDEHARILCEYNTTSYYSNYGYISKNYTFLPAYSEPDYGSWFWYVFLSFLILWVVNTLIRISLYYIALGKKPDWGNEFKRII
jgi:hypothetical protein